MSAHFFETSARSAIGLVRQGNEDSAFTSAQLIAVADGMGGHAAGEDASRIAVQVLQKLAPTLAATDIDEDSVEDLLMHSLHSIDAEIAAATDEEIEKCGMGTTLTALLIRDNKIALLHVGDSGVIDCVETHWNNSVMTTLLFKNCSTKVQSRKPRPLGILNARC